MNTDDITNAFFGIFPKEFMGDLLRLIASQCKDSKEECFSFYPKEEGFDLLGSLRRAKIESKARKLVEAWPNIIAEPISSRKSGNGNYHTEISSNNGFLTIHKVQFKGTLVRKAIYRDSYARRTNYSLFEPAAPEPSPGSILYAQLKYGVDKRIPQLLAFAVIDFPDEEGKIVCSIDLLRMEQYMSIPSEFVQLITTEEIEDNLNLNLRTDVKKKSKGKSAGGEKE